MEDYPNNSTTAKVEPQARGDHKVEQVITGKVIVKKPSPFRRLAANLTDDTGRGIIQRVVQDVLVPAGKAAVVDAGIELLNQTFYPNGGGRRVSGSSANPFIASVGSTLASKVSYSTMSTQAAQQKAAKPAQKYTRGRVTIDDVILENRASADMVIDGLRSLIDRFGVAKVADLFDFVGVTGEYTDEKFGWVSLDGARARPTAEGYRLDLPAPVQLT